MSQTPHTIVDSTMLGSTVDDDTLLGYRTTEYRVLSDPPFTLQVGEQSPPLAELQAAHGCTSSAFITACNPYSMLLSELENSQRQAALAAELQQTGYSTLAAAGADPTGDWPLEPGFLVLGIRQEQAEALGQRFQQNAILWSGSDAVPQLVMLR